MEFSKKISGRKIKKINYLTGTKKKVKCGKKMNKFRAKFVGHDLRFFSIEFLGGRPPLGVFEC
jgi:hypothetical protein